MKTKLNIFGAPIDLLCVCGRCGAREVFTSATWLLEAKHSPEETPQPWPAEGWETIPHGDGRVWGCKACVATWKQILADAKNEFAEHPFVRIQPAQRSGT